MGIIQNNFEIMNTSEVLHESINNASDFRVRFNCEFLYKCAFHCPGCYVNRKASNFTEESLDTLIHTIALFRNGKFTFDEIILGPTDFFAADNTKKLLENPKFNNIFKDGDVVLTVLTTLQTSDEEILETIECVNKHFNFPGMEMEILIVPELNKIIDNDLSYVESFNKKIELLNHLNPDIDYAIQMNIMDPSKITSDFSLTHITKFVRNHFNTIVEFNPSFLRVGKDKISTPILEAWNTMLSSQIDDNNYNDITFTMANTYHAGFNEITYNFHDGEFYMCPFIYENVFDKNENFKIPKDGDQYTLTDFSEHDIRVKSEMFNYLSSTDECLNCSMVSSCISKHVQFYMKHYGITKCMISKPTANLYQ